MKSELQSRWKIKICHGLRIVGLAALGLAAYLGPKAAIAGPPIGINIQNVADWNGDLLFADAMKEGRGWMDPTGTTSLTGSQLDSNGWPNQDTFVYVWAGAPSDMSGTYALSFNGQATISSSGTISNQAYNSGTNTTTATVTTTNQDMTLQFTSTKKTSSSGTNTGITNVKLMRPTVPGGTTSYAAGTLFTNQIKNLVSKFGTTRFMDYSATNSNAQVNWADRLNANYYSANALFPSNYGYEGIGGAWEYAVQLCNQTNTDLWINIPVAATDAYVTNIANLILYGSDGVNPYTSTQGSPVWAPLNSGRKVYVEFSNEVWNTAGPFLQSTTNHDAAVAEVNAGSPLNWDGDTNDWYWAARRTAKRTVEISNIFRTVFGSGAMMSRVRPVLESQEGYTGFWLLEQTHMLEDYYNNANHVSSPHPPNYYIYGGGGSAYYGPDNSSDTLTISNIWTSGTFDITQWAPICQGESNYALSVYGKRVAYEGGPSMDNVGHSEAIKAQAWGDARMAGIITGHQTLWNQDGGDLITYYQSVGDYQWGFTHDVNNLNTPKLNGINTVNGSTQATSTYGVAIPGTVTASAYGAPETWAGADPSNFNATGNWEWTGYVVNNATTGAFNIALSAGSAGTTNKADIYVDGNLVGTITIPNTGSNTTYATSGTITTPSLAAGSHGFLIKANAGSFGVNTATFTTASGGPPPAPTGLTATPGNAQIALSWSASTGATSYNVYRGTAAGGESTTAIVTGISPTNYTNTGLTNGTAYFYKVKAVNASGTSGYSNEASATPSGGTSGLVSINAGGPAVSPFIADADFSGGTAATNWTGTITTTGVTNPAPQAVYQSERYGTETYTIPGLVSGTPYTVRLHFCENYWTATGARKFNVSINSTSVLTNFDIFATAGAIHKANVQQFSTTGNASGQIVIVFTSVTDNALVNGIEVLAASAPPAPTGLTATPGNAQVALSWSASTGATSYNVYRGTAAGGESTTAIVTGISPTNYTNTGLTNGTTYYYKVKAVNASGTSGYSNEASATPSAGGSGNTHGGTWAAKGVLTGATWNDLAQTPAVASSKTYTASFWMKGTGKIVLNVYNGSWGTLITSQTFTSTSSWAQYSMTVATGSNTTMTWDFSDGGGVAGTIYIDDCFFGVANGTNVLGNPGFESGNNGAWSSVTTPTWSILQNP